TLTATPAVGWRLSAWSGDATGTANPLSVTLDANKAITATFVIQTFPITATAGPGGSIAPSGTTVVNYGSGQSYTITPALHYHVPDVLVDGASVGAVASYTFTNVTADHTIAASFAIDTYTLTVSLAGNGTGSVARSPNQATYPWGSTVQLTATPG